MAFSPETGLAYIPAQELPMAYAKPTEDFKSYWNTGADLSAGWPASFPGAARKAVRAMLKGRLLAWDPVARAPRWSVEMDHPWNGGVLSTAGGLVFQGRVDGTFAAYEAMTGEERWSIDAKSGVAAAPSTYTLDGEKYIAVATGFGSLYGMTLGLDFEEAAPPAVGRVVVFKLGADGNIPDHAVPLIPATPKGAQFGDAAQIVQGSTHFNRHCGTCHGAAAISSGVLPDLRWSSISADPSAWSDVVHGGVLASNGMVSFSDKLDAEEIEAVRAYVLARAHEDAATTEEGAGD